MKSPQAWFEHVLPPLSLDCFFVVARQRRNHVDTLRGEELGGVLLPRAKQHGQVAAVDDTLAQRTCTAHESAEMWVQLGCPAGQIDRMNARRRDQELEDPFHRGCLHHLGAFRACLDVTVLTRQVAQLTQIDLQNLELCSLKRKPVLTQRAREERR